MNADYVENIIRNIDKQSYILIIRQDIHIF